MRYGPVKNVKKHEKLHRKVKKLFSAFTLFTLYAFLLIFVNNDINTTVDLSASVVLARYQGTLPSS